MVRQNSTRGTFEIKMLSESGSGRDLAFSVKYETASIGLTPTLNTRDIALTKKCLWLKLVVPSQTRCILNISNM